MHQTLQIIKMVETRGEMPSQDLERGRETARARGRAGSKSSRPMRRNGSRVRASNLVAAAEMIREQR